MHLSLPASKIFVLLLNIISSQAINAQMAIIKDPDGFSNVRSGASTQSKIEDTLSNGRLVYILPEDSPSNWLSIDYNKGEKHGSGYIHKSRIVFLQAMTAFKATTVKDTLLKLELNDMLITIKAGAFVKTGRKITYENPGSESQTIKAIDGKHPWGTDGFLPNEEYKSIQIRSGAGTFSFPKTKYNDLFHPSLDRTSASLDKETNTIYLYADNGDAAGSYSLVWIIKNGKIEHREVFIPF